MVKASMSVICFEKYVFDKSDSIFYLTLPRARGSNAEILIFASPAVPEHPHILSIIPVCTI